jgi:ABC-2 type transport system ATP-binding protein
VTGVGIEVRNASVDFPIFDAKTRSLKKQVLSRVGGGISADQRVPLVCALRDINLSLRAGDRLALIGRNGAGKTTLLRTLAGIYEPIRGSAKIVGRVAPVFELGVGMDPDATGYQNIIVHGLFLGMTRARMRTRIAEIAEFTEIGGYLDMPLRAYSTGMRVRLALGVVTSIDPEILLLDEGIGAIDADFLDRARTRLHELVDRAGVLVFASHTEDLLLDFCAQAIWLDGGRIVERGPAAEVLARYRARVSSHSGE